MKIESVRIQNFRTFKDETIYFDDYTCIVGSNGAGKSTVFNALNIFFRQYKDSKSDLSKLSIDDFHHRDTSNPISITVTFKDLSASAKQSLSDYVRQDKLIVTAKALYDEKKQIAEVKQFGNRLGINEFRIWFEARKSKKSAAELKEIFSQLRQEWTGIDTATSAENMASALQKFEADHSDKCELIPSEDEFYGVTKGTNKIEPHIQWVFVSAAKDISEEAEETKNSALGQLLLRAIRAKVNFTSKVNEFRESLKIDYQKMLDAEQSVLTDLSNSLESKLKIWGNPNASAKVQWKQDTEKSIKIDEPWAHIQLGEKGFESELSRFGHGMQRSYMLTLLQELAEIDTEYAPTLVMAIEEPELYQHPPQAQHLSEVLQDLSADKSQIMVCSHSPYFIPGDNFDSIRIVREEGTPTFSKINYLTYDELSGALTAATGETLLKEQGMIAKLYPVLKPELSEMFFCRKLVLVEGIEDVAYLTTYLQLTNKIIDFRRGGFHIIPVGGKSELIKPLAIANLLKIPVFVVCDADTDQEKYADMHKKDNSAILHLLGMDKSQNWPTSTIIGKTLRMWHTNITDTIKSEFGDIWKECEDQSAAYYGNAGKLKKNPLVVSKALEIAWSRDLKSESLIELTNNILEL